LTTIRLTKRYGYLEHDDLKAVMSFARTLHVRYRWEGRILLFDPCRAGLDAVRGAFPGSTIFDPDGVIDHIKELEEIESKPRVAGEVPFVFEGEERRGYQRLTFNLTAPAVAAAIFIPFGMGKTCIGVDTTAYLYEQGLIDQALIVAPEGVHRQWIEEQFPRWWPKRLPLEAMRFTRTYKPKKFWPAGRGNGLRVLAAHMEMLSGAGGLKFLGDYLKQGRTIFNLDESLRIKTPGSQRSKNAAKLRDLAAYRRLFTGGPITKGLEDLFAQFRFLDPAIVGYDTFTAFKNRYCVEGGYDPDDHFANRKIVAYQNTEELMAKIRPYTVVVDKSLLRKHDPTFVERWVEMTPDQRVHYQSFAERLFTEIKSGEIVDAAHAAVRLIRFQQILAGFLPKEDGTFERIATYRYESLLSALEEIDGKVIIWARFREEIEEIKRRLGDAAVTYYGGDDKEQRAANKIAFLTSDDVRYFVASAAVAGAGLDGLQTVCCTAINFSSDFDADHRRNSIARLDRSGVIGGTEDFNPVTIVDMIVRGTVDRKILASFATKETIAQMVMRNPSLILMDDE
jgi:hypothetical protein